MNAIGIFECFIKTRLNGMQLEMLIGKLSDQLSKNLPSKSALKAQNYILFMLVQMIMIE
jgi:hypothetical protein